MCVYALTPNPPFLLHLLFLPLPLCEMRKPRLALMRAINLLAPHLFPAQISRRYFCVQEHGFWRDGEIEYAVFCFLLPSHIVWFSFLFFPICTGAWNEKLLRVGVIAWIPFIPPCAPQRKGFINPSVRSWWHHAVPQLTFHTIQRKILAFSVQRRQHKHCNGYHNHLF